MDEEDVDMYSSPYGNYLRLVDTIKTLESNFHMTEDWYFEHKQHILKYREIFPNFIFVNGEIENKEFRKKASEAEVLLSNLIHAIQAHNTIDIRLYLVLNKHLKFLCETIWEDDALSNMMSEMSM